jgi:hypothetical protein
MGNHMRNRGRAVPIQKIFAFFAAFASLRLILFVQG